MTFLKDMQEFESIIAEEHLFEDAANYSLLPRYTPLAELTVDALGHVMAYSVFPADEGCAFGHVDNDSHGSVCDFDCAVNAEAEFDLGEPPVHNDVLPRPVEAEHFLFRLRPEDLAQSSKPGPESEFELALVPEVQPLSQPQRQSGPVQGHGHKRRAGGGKYRPGANGYNEPAYVGFGIHAHHHEAFDTCAHCRNCVYCSAMRAGRTIEPGDADDATDTESNPEQLPINTFSRPKKGAKLPRYARQETEQAGRFVWRRVNGESASIRYTGPLGLQRLLSKVRGIPIPDTDESDSELEQELVQVPDAAGEDAMEEEIVVAGSAVGEEEPVAEASKGKDSPDSSELSDVSDVSDLFELERQKTSETENSPIADEVVASGS